MYSFCVCLNNFVFQAHDESVKKPKGEVDNVRVAVRCRPMGEKELRTNCKSIVNVDQTRGEVTGVCVCVVLVTHHISSLSHLYSHSAQS